CLSRRRHEHHEQPSPAHPPAAPSGPVDTGRPADARLLPHARPPGRPVAAGDPVPLPGSRPGDRAGDGPRPGAARDRRRPRGRPLRDLDPSAPDRGGRISAPVPGAGGRDRYRPPFIASEDLMTNILVDHNRPPADADPLAERLRETYAQLHQRAEQLLEAEARLPDSLTEDTVGRVSDFVGQTKACIKAAEQAHKTEKEPFLSAGRTVDGWLRGIKDPLSDLARRVEARITAYLRAREEEERRRLAEEARRLAEEAEAREAQGDQAQAKEVRAEARELREEARHGKPADLVRTHTGMGNVATLRTQWTGEIVDRDKLDLEKLRP